MSDVVLSVVEPPDLEGRPVLGFTAYPELHPFSTGLGTMNLLCGGCRFVLVAGASVDDAVPRMLIRCPACGSLNDPPAETVPAPRAHEGW